MKEYPDYQAWEHQVNALLDGELSDEQTKTLRAAAESDPMLNRLIEDALELQQTMLELSRERAPSSLQQKLRDIPLHRSPLGASPEGTRKGIRDLIQDLPALFSPRWGVALATVVLAVSIGINQLIPKEPTEMEIAQARQDLSVAMTYLARVSRKTSNHITLSIGHGISRPVTKNTVRILSDQFGFNEE